ncbi:hypothetical protein PR048_026920 [Dryococelus australis]|uniref:CHK kinase-like domain-containing protein n=1 Tax=Dryococelus australis TaxID=614101 RepID=A0ABQ9GML9_9NEOP|nr:hypothetical protein PR048_026920 [Dryococelus australis]
MTTRSGILSTQDVEKLLQPTLNAEGSRVEGISVRSLTKPGDNYGSTMLAVDVSLSPGPRTLHFVAKMLPKSAVIQELFQCEVTVRKEVNTYLLVSPAYERIQKENNVPEDKYIDVFPKCYAARTSSKGSAAPVDDSAIILQENLKVQGFECGNRFTGLDLAHCKIVVDKLARFHATAIAMKLEKPEEFKATVLQTTTKVTIGPPDRMLIRLFENVPEYESLKERIETSILKSKKIFDGVYPSSPREPFATLIHLDLWTNNIMFQYRPGSSKINPTSLKFVDFQVTGYGSPARDLIFFLYTSASLEVLSENFDKLVRLYHENFLDCLRILGCDATPFSFDEFLKEIEYSSLVEFWHIGFMLNPINVPEKDAINIDTATLDDVVAKSKLAETYFPRASKFLSDFASKNWI